MYSCFNILGGFVQFSGGKIWVFHKNKLNSVPIATLLKENKARYDVAKGFHISGIFAVIEKGDPDNPVETLFTLQCINTVASTILSVLRTKKNMLKMKIHQVYLPKESKFTVTVRAVLWLTPLFLVLSIIKTLLNERLNHAKRKRKQTV